MSDTLPAATPEVEPHWAEFMVPDDFCESESAASIAIAPRVFTIDNAPKLDWLTRQVLGIRQGVTDAKFWLRSIEERAGKDEADLLAHFGQQAESVVRNEARRGTKTLSLPAGTASLRFTPEGLEIADAEECENWCRAEAQDVLQTEIKLRFSGLKAEFRAELIALCQKHEIYHDAKTSVSKSALKTHFYKSGTGEVPAGCVQVLPQERLYFAAHKAQTAPPVALEGEEKL